ncbi:linear amide C-N hydrolase [Marinobacter bohaiensis]|uniref:linear amide C-N hydrolase n=1 Tax=Marinobacter bohaiensis TaxID=2201898 RepID=UPI000DABD9F8|nr:linear amide C-N hydrolase [Marinobacter bohaiensis]
MTLSKRSLALLCCLVSALFTAATAYACTRAVYLGPDDRVLTGRSMDWRQEWEGNLWILPRGIERAGRAGPRSVEWTSRYGSVIVTGYEVATADGLNEAGLMVNALWLTDSEYPEDDGETPRLSLSLWAQFVLDRFGSVGEAVSYLRDNPIDVVTGEVPGQPGRLANIHLSLSDKSGDSAIVEWIDGEMRIHHGRQYQVMTNEPVFDDQLAITKYWSKVDGLSFLPGSSRPEDRFARASFLINAVEKHDDQRMAAASVFSVMRNVSAPYGVSIDDQPNLSTTRWRVVADHKDMLYYFESVVSPNLFWVDLKKVDFSNAAGVRKLDLGPRQQHLFAGDVSGEFEPAAPFEFMAAE